MPVLAKSIHFHTVLASLVFTVLAVFTSFQCTVFAQFCPSVTEEPSVELWRCYRDQVLYFLFPEHSREVP